MGDVRGTNTAGVESNNISRFHAMDSSKCLMEQWVVLISIAKPSGIDLSSSKQRMSISTSDIAGRGAQSDVERTKGYYELKSHVEQLGLLVCTHSSNSLLPLMLESSCSN